MKELITFALTLFLVMDPLGNIPLFLTSLRPVDPHRRQRVLARELLIALGVMVVFLFIGGRLLTTLHVTQPALTAAGGLILLLIAVRMIFPSPEFPLRERIADEPFIVPLAVPYTAGPSVLATEVIFFNQAPEKWPWLLLAVFAAWAAAAIILYGSSYLQRILGEKTLMAIERLMGMVLIIVATQMVLGGIKAFFVA